MLVVSAGVAAFVYVQVRGDLRHQVDLGLRARAQALVARPAALDDLRSTSGSIADNDESFAQLLAADGRVLAATRSVAATPLLTPAELRGTRPRLVDRHPPGLDASRLLVVRTTNRGGDAYLVVGATLSDTSEALRRLLLLLAAALPVAVAVSSGLGWWLAGAALAPVRRMSEEAAAVDAGEPGQRLAVPRSDPGLARLAATLNETFDRLQQAIDRERSFASNASHELRTPLTILKAEVDTALSRPRDAAELRGALVSAGNEVEQLIRIAEGLLAIARMRDGRVPIDRRPAPLRALVDDRVAAFAGRAEANGIAITASTTDAVVDLDPLRVRQAVDNLLDNAVRHARTTVDVSAAVRGQELALAVRDDGPGFTRAAMDAAFQPFNRATGNPDGAGLGLALARAVAEAHGGTAAARNRDGGGAEVTLVLPVRVQRPERSAV
jgi:signal transduction histidine kinase